MSTDLEELVEFLHHGNAQIRQIACEHLVGYSASHTSLFKRHQLLPVQDLKLLVRDYPQISKNAISILINLSHDEEVLKSLATDDAFLETLLRKITDLKDPDADDISMLLANLAKSPSLDRLITLQRNIPTGIPTSATAMDQLLDLFVKGSTRALNKTTTFDHLSYLFADLSQHAPVRSYFLTSQPHDHVIPLSKLTVFTEHPNHVRRKGVANTIKNVAFDVDRHHVLLDPEPEGIHILPYILLPLAGNEEFDDEESAAMLPDLQLLPPDKSRDTDPEILTVHLETLLLLTTTRAGRDLMRRVKVYPLVRECHLHVEDEQVREVCERLVNVLMRDEEGEGVREQGKVIGEVQEKDDDEEEKIVEIF